MHQLKLKDTVATNAFQSLVSLKETVLQSQPIVGTRPATKFLQPYPRLILGYPRLERSRVRSPAVPILHTVRLLPVPSV